jgi:quinol monooxygenase YgiN
MIGGIKKVRVKTGEEQALEALFSELKSKVKENEPGNLYYDLYRSQTEPGCYVVMERYMDKAALDAHKSSAYSAHYFPKIRALLDKIDVEYFDSV